MKYCFLILFLFLVACSSAPKTQQNPSQAFASEVDKKIGDLNNSMAELTTTVSNVMNQTLEAVSGTKANTTAMTDRIETLNGNLMKVSESTASFMLDATRAKMMSEIHAREMDRQKEYATRTQHMYEKTILLVILLLVGFLCIALGDNIHQWFAKLVIYIIGFICLLGAPACFFFYDSIIRFA